MLDDGPFFGSVCLKARDRLLQAWRRRKTELKCEGILGAAASEQVAGPDRCPAGVLGPVVQGWRHNEPAVVVLLNIPSLLPVRLSVFDKYKQTQEVTRTLLRPVLIWDQWHKNRFTGS